MVNEKIKKQSPPYVSYRTFHNFLELLQHGMPARIDRSFWGDRWSGSTGNQLMASLRFLTLIDDNGIPTPRLKTLIFSQGPQRMDFLKQIAFDAYKPILGSIDTDKATYAQLDECFHNLYQLTGDVSRKCIKFFIELASESNITLSPFMVKKQKRSKSGIAVSNSKKNPKKAISGTIQNSVIPINSEEVPENSSWTKMVLSKFPTFDPAWPDEIKIKWFDAFDRLLDRRTAETSARK